MSKRERILDLIKHRRNIPISLIDFIDITGDGNCLFRATSYFLYGNEDQYKEIRKLVYQEAKNNKEELKPFFFEDTADDTLVNTKLENYIERIKEDCFYGGIIEIGIISNYYDINISVYCTDNNDPNQYVHFTNIWKDERLNNFMILHYNQRLEHFSILNFNGIQIPPSTNQIIINHSKQNFKKIINDIKDNNKENLRSNTYVKINNNTNYFNDIYNYLYSKKLYRKSNNKIDWKKVIYPADLINIKEKVKRDKKRQNFREIAEKYMLDEKNDLFIKIKNKGNQIEKYKIPYESEKISLFIKCHDKKGHIGYKRMIEEIKEENFYWKSIRNDCKQYVLECPSCIKSKAGKLIKPIQKKIITKGPKERYVIDGWKLHEDLADISGYKWVIDIIDHFSKYMMSFPVVNNNAENALNCFKEFCILKGYPKILQSDNGVEYKNNLFEKFCTDHNIKHIFSSPYHPQSNGVVEVAHKEIKKNVIIDFSKHPENFNLKTSLLEAVEIHNNNIHTTTLYRPVELFENTDEEIYLKVIENIKKRWKIKEINDIDLKPGKHILIKNNIAKAGKRLVKKKFKLREYKIPGTITNNYENGLLAIKIDENIGPFIEGEELIADINHILLISDKEWNSLMNEPKESKEKKDIKVKKDKKPPKRRKGQK